MAEAVIEVWAGNWRAFCAFLDLSSQWRWQFDGERRWLSLDYAGVDVVLRRGGYDDVNFSDLQLMERAAIDAFEGR
ncbi:uncharacterized protein DUF1799 [Rhodobacter aestuarii]|uniref:Uncharacterized protein n=1 Tax=Rhodobacter aestuarii TaxID=453582 RepID=A0A1N7Q137_9RHOB|nr:DUF1799 domain-containing protein [Rhodobacter aestuarii]PTV94017.1 uncharacterized protein DUF1799 [Rhodobacter aestuarii]SIT16604.1 Phage related hypothetical protein [Rhodobacter aestuarii]